METHSVLAKKNFKISSYGTGDKVKIPGPTPCKFLFHKHKRQTTQKKWKTFHISDQPNVYPFGDTTYEEIYNDLIQKDKKLYTGWYLIFYWFKLVSVDPGRALIK